MAIILPKPEKSDKEPYSFRLSKKMMDDFKKYADLTNRTQTEVLTEMIEDKIKNKTLERGEYEEIITVHLPIHEDDIQEFIDTEIDVSKDPGHILPTYKIKINIRQNNYLDFFDEYEGTFKAQHEGYNVHLGLTIITNHDINLMLYDDPALEDETITYFILQKLYHDSDDVECYLIDYDEAYNLSNKYNQELRNKVARSDHIFREEL